MAARRSAGSIQKQRAATSADLASGSILVHVVDGTRQPLATDVKWSAKIHDGRSPNEWKMFNVDGSGPIELIKDLTLFNNFFDNYTVLVNANGWQSTGWAPVHIEAGKPIATFLMLLPKDGHINFSNATWQVVGSRRPRFIEIISAGTDNPSEQFSALMERQEGLVLGCLLNLLTAMSQITLASQKTPLDYYWQPIWDDPQFAMAQDRFFAYVDKKIIDDVVLTAKMGAFSEEKDPGSFHPGATLSYKQTQFDVANVQLTFHQGNGKTIQTPGGPVDCVVIEPDIDYYKDLLAHGLLEVLPNKFTRGLTDPRGVCLLRWMAAKQIGLDFDPLYWIVA
jgi:hypothetical protein